MRTTLECFAVKSDICDAKMYTCTCPQCAIRLFIDVHILLGFEAVDLVESFSHGLTLVLASVPEDIVEEIVGEVLSNIEKAVMLRVEGPIEGDTIH